MCKESCTYNDIFFSNDRMVLLFVLSSAGLIGWEWYGFLYISLICYCFWLHVLLFHNIWLFLSLLIICVSVVEVFLSGKIDEFYCLVLGFVWRIIFILCLCFKPLPNFYMNGFYWHFALVTVLILIFLK